MRHSEHYKQIITNLINMYCNVIYTDDWGKEEWQDFLESIGFEVEEINNFLSDNF